uniref:Hydrophobin n=1 Tax=Ganoderma boninense TaxID=34458 RepID=A0A5K1K5H6_9APHY|nr:Exonuclease domain-containing protein [Ganoderma boninense]
MTMIARMLALTLALLPILGGAASTSLAARDTCDSGAGTLLCCDLLASANDPVVVPILASLGIPPSSVDGPVGVTCTPVSSNQACPTQRACCIDNDFDGVVALDCTEA